MSIIAILLGISFFSYFECFRYVSALCGWSSNDLTGTWKANDGGTYYIRQIGNDIWWFGSNTFNIHGFSNVVHGLKSGNSISALWADVPMGFSKNSGLINLIVSQDGSKLTKTYGTGGFSGQIWERQCNDVILHPVPYVLIIYIANFFLKINIR